MRALPGVSKRLSDALFVTSYFAAQHYSIAHSCLSTPTSNQTQSQQKIELTEMARDSAKSCIVASLSQSATISCVGNE